MIQDCNSNKDKAPFETDLSPFTPLWSGLETSIVLGNVIVMSAVLVLF